MVVRSADRRHRVTGGVADVSDMAVDLLGGSRRLAGELLDLAGDHREAFAGIAGARRLDGGVQRQQVGLGGDRR